jgi:hypothetical protein
MAIERHRPYTARRRRDDALHDFRAGAGAELAKRMNAKYGLQHPAMVQGSVVPRCNDLDGDFLL